MGKIISIIAGFILFFSSIPVNAMEFADREFPDSIILAGTNKTLQLNGIGFRKKFIIKVYIGALYLERKVNSRDAIVALDGPKRILLHIVYDEISSKKLVDAWNDGFEGNLSKEQRVNLGKRIDAFNTMFSTVHKNDVIQLDYVPNAGTHVIINDVDKGVIVGKDFNDALLNIWLGEEPADDDLKDAMLGIE